MTPARARTHSLDMQIEPPGRHVVDETFDVFGAEAASARLAASLEQIRPRALRVDGHDRPLLEPQLAPGRDHVEGPAWASSTIVVFGAHVTPWSRQLGRVLTYVRDRHAGRVRVAWRHYPDPAAHPRAAIFALATEAASS